MIAPRSRGLDAIDNPAQTRPHRIQLSRKKGWRMPENTVKVSRGSRWGNPFIVGQPCGVFPEGMGMHGKAETMIVALTLDQAIDFYRHMVLGFLSPEMYPTGHDWVDRFRRRNHASPGELVRDLRGKNLACWCKLDQPCHADILLELANG